MVANVGQQYKYSTRRLVLLALYPMLEDGTEGLAEADEEEGRKGG